jgi:hypothetical protein
LFFERKYAEIVEIARVHSQTEIEALLDLRDVQHEIGCALSMEGEMEFGRQLVSSSFLPNYVIRESPDPALWLAQFKYYFYEQIDEALEDFETLAAPEFASGLSPEISPYVRQGITDSVESFLTEIYFIKAVEVFKAGLDPEPWLTKLRNLSIVADPATQETTYLMRHASSLLGIFYRQYELADRSKWTPCFRDSILLYIDMLGNEDPTDDQSAYSGLGEQLLHAGDVVNAAAAFAVTVLPWSFTGNATPLKALADVGFENYWMCDGLCTSYVPEWRVYKASPFEELHMCQTCDDVCFCGDCLALLKKGGLPYRQCSPDHELLQIFPVPESARDVAARFVDEKTVEVNAEWLNSLKKNWE